MVVAWAACRFQDLSNASSWRSVCRGGHWLVSNPPRREKLEMSAATRSIQVWAIYTLVVGAALLLIPNTFLGLFQIEETNEVWVRVIGVVVLVLTIYYAFMVRVQSRDMFQATIYGRGFSAVLLVVLAFVVGLWQLALFAVLDAAGATWTHLTITRTPTKAR